MNELEKFRQQNGDQDKEAEATIQALQNLEIHDEEDAGLVGRLRIELNDRLKQVEAERKKIADPQHKAWKATNAFFKRFTAPLATAVGITDQKLREWKHKQLEAAREAEALAQKAATAAIEAQAEGDQEKAAEAFQEAQQAIAIAAAPQTKTKGLQERVKWYAEVTNMELFLQALVADPGLWGLVEPNQRLLNELAREVKVEGNAPGVPGVEIKKETVFAS